MTLDEYKEFVEQSFKDCSTDVLKIFRQFKKEVEEQNVEINRLHKLLGIVIDNGSDGSRDHCGRCPFVNTNFDGYNDDDDKAMCLMFDDSILYDWGGGDWKRCEDCCEDQKE